MWKKKPNEDYHSAQDSTDLYRSTDLNIKWRVNVWRYWFASDVIGSFALKWAIFELELEIF